MSANGDGAPGLEGIEALQVLVTAAAQAPLPKIGPPGVLTHNLVEVAANRLHELLLAEPEPPKRKRRVRTEDAEPG